MSKKTKWFMIGLVVINIVLLFSTFYSFEKNTEKPSPLLGTYQSKDTNPKGMVMLSFSDDKAFEEYSNSKLIDSGTFIKEKKNVYILQSDLKNEMVVLFKEKNDQFYFYSDDKQVYLLEKISDTPTGNLNNHYSP
ncbi:MAG TPA: hypothetical protein H9829_11040 [Candidatus Tetragenococcus pullicola]|nr:hypothetical protein [Candidatus Tetragenococcus pullicola]